MASTDTLPDGQAKVTNTQQQDSPAVAPSEASNAVPRENMIETAMRFLQKPQVRTSPLAQKRAFLQKKGLTTREIEIAIDRSGTRQDVAPPAAPVETPTNQAMVPAQGGQMQQQQMVPYGQPVPSRFSSWRDYMAVAVIVGGVSYGIYKLIQKFLMPFLKSRQEERERLERLEASIQELNQKVLKTVEKVETAVMSIQGLLEHQQAKLDTLTASMTTNRAIASHTKTSEISEVKSEITSLKGLLLNRHQFPASPQPSPIPAWQRVTPAIDSTPIKPCDTQPPPTADLQVTETKMAPTDTQNDSEVGVTNDDSGDVNHNASLVNGDETLDMNIHATLFEGAPGITNQSEVVQTT